MPPPATDRRTLRSVSLLDDVCVYAATLDGAWRDPAWDIEGVVFKTASGRIFVMCSGDAYAPAITLKLPKDELSAALTLSFTRVAIWPSGWLTATVTVEAERDIVLQWVEQSYQLATTRRRK